MKSIAWRFAANVNEENGKVVAVYAVGGAAAVVNAAASFVWSNAGAFVLASGSTSSNSLPPRTDLRYVNTSDPSTHVIDDVSIVSNCLLFSRVRALFARA